MSPFRKAIQRSSAARLPSSWYCSKLIFCVVKGWSLLNAISSAFLSMKMLKRGNIKTERKLFIGVCICVSMVKVISLSNSAYQLLLEAKNKNESFSDVVTREIKKEKRDITKFFGIWRNDKEITKAFKEVYAGRKRFKLRDVRL